MRGVQRACKVGGGHEKPPRRDLVTRGRRRDDRGRDQGRRRASVHEEPALGDLGDELARDIAQSVFIAERSDIAV